MSAPNLRMLQKISETIQEIKTETPSRERELALDHLEQAADLIQGEMIRNNREQLRLVS